MTGGRLRFPEGKPARTISDIGLGELFIDGLVLDLGGKAAPNAGIEVAALRQAITENGAPNTPGCVLLLRTGQEAFGLGDPQFYAYPGKTREGTLFLADTGPRSWAPTRSDGTDPSPLFAAPSGKPGTVR